jgi:hypothetical protein
MSITVSISDDLSSRLVRDVFARVERRPTPHGMRRTRATPCGSAHLEELAGAGRRECRVVLDLGDPGLEMLVTALLRDRAKLIPAHAASRAWPPRARDLVHENAARLRSLAGKLAQVPTTRAVLDCGFGRLGFACSHPLAPVGDALAAYYRVHRDEGGEPVAVVGIASESLLDEATDLVLDHDQQAWSKTFGHPALAAGDGHAVFREPGGAIIGWHRLVTLKSAAPIVCFRPDGVSPWWVLYSERPPDHAAQLARVLRVFASHMAHRLGGWSAHASAFVGTDGRAYVLCGVDGAGKTTNLIAALATVPGARLLSNDRVTLVPDGAEVRAYGFPHSIGVRGGTLALFDRLRPLLTANGDGHSGRRLAYDHVLSSPDDIGDPSLRGAEFTVFVSPDELAALLGTKVAVSARLGGFIELEPRTGASGDPWVRVTDASLTRHRHEHFDNGAPFWTRLLGSPTPAETSPPRGAARVPVWRLASRGDLTTTWIRFQTIVATE